MAGQHADPATPPGSSSPVHEGSAPEGGEGGKRDQSKKTGRAKADTTFEVRPHKLKGKRLARPGAPKTFGSRRK